MEAIDSIRQTFRNLGLEQVTDTGYYKESDNTLEYNYCLFSLFQDKFLSIKVGKKNKDAERRILSMYHIHTSDEIMYVIKRLSYLKHLFPQIVSVPEINIIP